MSIRLRGYGVSMTCSGAAVTRDLVPVAYCKSHIRDLSSQHPAGSTEDA
jgi:hypothetical protein